MINRSKLIAALLGLAVAGSAVADASAATVVTRTRSIATTHAIHPVIAKKTVTIAHRFHHPRLGYRLAPRIRLAHVAAVKHVVTAKRVVKTTVVR